MVPCGRPRAKGFDGLSRDKPQISDELVGHIRTNSAGCASCMQGENSSKRPRPGRRRSTSPPGCGRRRPARGPSRRWGPLRHACASRRGDGDAARTAAHRRARSAKLGLAERLRQHGPPLPACRNRAGCARRAGVRAHEAPGQGGARHASTRAWGADSGRRSAPCSLFTGCRAPILRACRSSWSRRRHHHPCS